MGAAVDAGCGGSDAVKDKITHGERIERVRSGDERCVDFVLSSDQCERILMSEESERIRGHTDRGSNE